VMPCTPERIWRALKTARDSGPGTQVTGDSATDAHGTVGHVSGGDAAAAHGSDAAPSNGGQALGGAE
jgi:hypothetical protein